MINNSFAHKRHIPEEELHAYLDQALSRSQCVEIESHLAVCPPCREQRDDIAALRDRTTALLSTMAPPTIHTPPYAELRQRHLERSARRQRLIRRSAWAASIVMALGFGWSARAFSPAGTEATPGTGELPAAPVEVATTTPTPAAAVSISDPARQTDPVPADTATQNSSVAELPAAEPLVANAAMPQPAPPAARFPSSLADRPLNEEPLLQFTSTNLIAQDELATDGVWRSLSWDGAMEQSVDDWVPRVDGLPVVNVQVKESDEEDAKPLMVVSQRLGTGEGIRTFSGPADEVTDLLARQSGQSITASLQILDNEDSMTTAGDSLVRQQSSGAERMLAIQGSISVDSLRTLLLRLR